MTERDLEQSMKIDIKLDVFEGPLDLLLHLIEKNKVSIYDIPIVEITNQYMEYIREMEKTYSMESMSEFLVMAATLLKIKSKMLLPQPEKEEEEDPREELVRRLTEYKMYKYAAEELKDLSVDAQKVFFKPETVPEEIRVLRGADPPGRNCWGHHFRKVKPDIPHGHAPEKGQRRSSAEPFRKDSERKI